MSEQLELPGWARHMADAPVMTRYLGPIYQAVLWFGEHSRTRYQITLRDGSYLTLSVAQAAAVKEMLDAEEGL